MRKSLEVFLFELRHQLRRASTFFYFVVLLGICFMFLSMLSAGPTLDGTYFNSPFAVLVTGVVGSILAVLIIAGFAADAATRDLDVRIHSLFYTTPIRKPEYLLGRFFGVFAVSALLLTALPAGSFIASWLPWVESESLGPFHASMYLTPYLLFALPNAFVATALIFGIASLTRRGIAGYAAAGFLIFFSLLCGKVLALRLGWDVAKLLDPLGYTISLEIWQSTNSLQKNAFVLPLDGALLTNRLLWLAAGLTLLTLAYARFRFAYQSVGRERTLLKSEADDDGRVATGIAVPAARRVFDTPTRMRQLLAVTMHSFRELHTSRVWWIVPFLAFLFIQAGPELATLDMGIPGPLTTARLVDFLSGDVSIFLTLLIALSAGELVWRERSARIHSLADVTPLPDWVSVAGKFLGLAIMLAATLMIFLVSGLALQTIVGTERYDLALYVQILFGLLLPEYLLTAALAIIVHVLLNQKYVANVLIAFTPITRDVVRRLGLDEELLLYGALPKWTYSEITGFGPQVEARLWFTLYFSGWALLFALLAYLFWFRGEEHHVRRRVALARARFTRGAAALCAVALAISAGAGGFIFYNTHVLDDLRSTAEMEKLRAGYEHRYGRYAALPQPALLATTLQVDFYPGNRTATIRGSYRLENRSGETIDAIHVTTSGGDSATNVSFDRASRLTVSDDELDYRIYTLDPALEPGESLHMDFGVDIETRIFRAQGSPPVVGNGSLLVNRPRDGDHWLPVVGYQAARELDRAALRRKHGLRERNPYPLLGDAPIGNEQSGYEKIHLETIVGTEAGQLGVAPGAMHRTWVENGRRYVHYITDAPVSNAWTILSANYAVHRAKWRDVDIEIFHHPSHTENLERMSRGVIASLEYNTREFGPYPHRQVRLVEYPSSADMVGMTAHDGLITYAEGFSLMRPEADPRRIDFPFAVAAHEVGHQWWGHQLAPAMVEGGPFLAESLAWYSAMLAVEETLGRDHLKRLLDMMRAHYLAPNRPRALPLLRSVDHLDAYRAGPFAMYALREAIGVDTVNRALRNLLATFPPGRAPYPTTLDFYAELRAATPPDMHGFLKDLFEDITFWDLRATSIEVAPAATAGHRVTLQVEAQKLKGDGTGIEEPVPMNDRIEIALYDAAGTPIYQARHRIRSGTQTIEILVPHEPARAAIDPDHELLDRNPDDNEVRFEASPSG